MGRKSPSSRRRTEGYSRIRHAMREAQRRGLGIEDGISFKLDVPGKIKLKSDLPRTEEPGAELQPKGDLFPETQGSTFGNPDNRMSPGHPERFS